MKAILLIGTGGAIGSLLRYGVTLLTKNFHQGVFPWPTFFVNLLGCFVIGIFFAWSLSHNAFGDIRLFVIIGLLGGFTTFSSFGLEVFMMIRERQFLNAFLYISGVNILGFLSVYLGYQVLK